jgi:hypothetical protein
MHGRVLFQLPRMGPFRLQGSFLPKQFLKIFFIFVFFAALGGGIAFYGGYIASEQIETSTIWAKGTEAARATYKGRVRTTNFIFKSYDLTLTFFTKEGKRFSRRVEFFRFFTGPSQKDRFTLRYLPSHPQKAMISWGYDAMVHGWIFAVLMVLVGLLILLGGFVIVRGILEDTALARRLVRKGEMVAAPVERVEEIYNEETKTVQYLYHFHFSHLPDVPHSYWSPSAKDAPLFDHEGKAMVALLEKASGDYRLLLHDGYPIVLPKY